MEYPRNYVRVRLMDIALAYGIPPRLLWESPEIQSLPWASDSDVQSNSQLQNFDDLYIGLVMKGNNDGR